MKNRDWVQTNTTMCSLYENVTNKNYLQFCQIALVQFKYFTENTSVSGSVILDWKFNYSNLYDYVCLNNINVSTCVHFIKAYDDLTPILQNRLGIY